MTTSVTDDRQAFEAWAKDSAYLVARGNFDGRYLEAATRIAFEAWTAALRSQGKVVSEEDVAKMQELAESWRVKYYDHLGEPAYLKCAEDLTAIIGEGIEVSTSYESPGMRDSFESHISAKHPSWDFAMNSKGTEFSSSWIEACFEGWCRGIEYQKAVCNGNTVTCDHQGEGI